MHDLKRIKQEYNSVEVPQEVDLVIEKAIRKERAARITRRVIKPLTAVVALALIFFVTVNASPGFANYVSKFPGMEAFVKLVSFDPGLVNVVNQGFGQVINKSTTENGITMTVKNAIYDGRKLVLLLEIESEKELGRISNIDNEVIGFYGDTGSYHPVNPDESNGHVFTHLLELELKAGEYRKDVLYKCYGFKHYYDNAQGLQEEETIHGNWTILFQLDADLALCQPKQVVINKEVTFGNAKFTVESMVIYPTVIDVNIVRDSSTPLIITGFMNPRLIDSNGLEFMCQAEERGDWETVYGGAEVTLSFESNYFMDSGELTLLMDGVYTIPKNGIGFTLDVENKRVLDDGSLGIEFLRTSIEDDWLGEENFFAVWYKIDDSEFLASKSKFLWIDEVKDLTGKEYQLRYSHRYSSEYHEDEFGLFFPVDDVPQTVRVKIAAISKGITEPVHLRLD